MASVIPRIRVASTLRSLNVASTVGRRTISSSSPEGHAHSSLVGSTLPSPSPSPLLLQFQYSRQNQFRNFSSTAAVAEVDHNASTSTRKGDVRTVEDDDYEGPRGELFQHDKEMGTSLVGKAGWVRRTFGPRSNAEAMLTCGGEALAAHASFDPDYLRAKGWIRQHAVGPAVLSPVLVSGLVGALVEAAFPQSVPDTQSITLLRPVIVGVEVVARIEVTNVVYAQVEGAATAAPLERNERRQHGYTVHLQTQVSRERDALVLAEGSHTVWIPDYLRM